MSDVISYLKMIIGAVGAYAALVAVFFFVFKFDVVVSCLCGLGAWVLLFCVLIAWAVVRVGSCWDEYDDYL